MVRLLTVCGGELRGLAFVRRSGSLGCLYAMGCAGVYLFR